MTASTPDPTATRPLESRDMLHWSPDTSTPDTPAMVRSHTGIPAPIDAELQRRAIPSRAAMLADATAADAAVTVNHERAKAAHIDQLATRAPGPQVPRRRRIDWQGVAALVAIAVVIVALVLLLNRPIVQGS